MMYKTKTEIFLRNFCLLTWPRTAQWKKFIKIPRQTHIQLLIPPFSVETASHRAYLLAIVFNLSRLALADILDYIV